MHTRLPAPSLVVLIGPSGSGKTTWAHANFTVNEVVSSDELRSRVGVGEDDQQASTAAFALLDQIVDERLRRGLTTVIDTLGIDDARRADWVSRAHEAGVPAFAVLFPADLATCEARNSGRARSIPKTVLRRQVSRFQAVMPVIEGEDFDGVLRERPVAVVAPQFVAPAQAHAEPVAATRHTFGLLINRFQWPEAPGLAVQLAEIARRAEKAGFRDLWVMDHFRQIPSVGRPWEDIPESYTALSYLAGLTERLRLGALVTGITHRNPVHLGKMIATLDVLSGGRANCGLGLAWDTDEHSGYGWEMPSTPVRYDLLEDTLEMLPLLWGKGSPEFNGRILRASGLTCYPRPIQEHIPILIGGSGERRTLRLVARYADACNLFGTPERVGHKVDILRGHCELEGRSFDQIEVTHLLTVVSAPDRKSLRERLELLRGRSSSAEEYARRNNAGIPDDHRLLVGAYAAAGATHTIVSMPDVHLEGSIESFADVVQSRWGS